MEGEARISLSHEPDCCVLRLEGGLDVAHAEELRQAALGLCAQSKAVRIDWSGATQVDAGIAQVLLSLRAGLSERNLALSTGPEIPTAIQNWLSTAGLSGVLGNPEQSG